MDNGEGTATESEDSSDELSRLPLRVSSGKDLDEGDETESSDMNDDFETTQMTQPLDVSTPPETTSSSRLDRGSKPRIIPRADQVPTGKLILKRPSKSYDGTPIPPLLPGERHSVPATINRYLRDYQRAGVRFFYERWCEGRGGVLGDDMGLGECNTVFLVHAGIFTSFSIEASHLMIFVHDTSY